MHPAFRTAFNAAYSDDLYRRYLADLEQRAGASAAFRLAETPVFLPEDLEKELVAAATGIIQELRRPELLTRLKGVIPPEWNAPGMDAFPALTQVDLAVVRGPDGRLSPRLIELQGFPSLSAFEILQADAWSGALLGIPGLPGGTWSPFFSGLNRGSFLELLRRTVVGHCDPEDVVLLDLKPSAQKTWVDFAATKKLLGVDPVDPSELLKEGRRLVRMKGGRRIPVQRIYNRIVFDELILSGVSLPFDFRDDLDVTWVPHPNWYWAISKAALPHLLHPAVPRTFGLGELAEMPADLSGWVLKPLFSFAGGGVRLGPVRADLERIPAPERSAWCLQERIDYEPALMAKDGGGVKVEVRMMFYRPDGEEKPVLGLNLCRLSRGTMLGVDFNRDFTWVGSSVAIRPA